MTTVAFRSGLVAADGLSTSGDTVVERSARKVFRLPDGRVCAGTGRRAIIVRYQSWLVSGGERPSLVSPNDGKGEGAAVLVAYPDGHVELHEEDGVFLIEAEFTALGSGEQAALAAMHMGADALQAVEIAARVDVFTGGVVHAEKVEPSLPLSEPEPGAVEWRQRYNLRSKR